MPFVREKNAFPLYPVSFDVIQINTRKKTYRRKNYCPGTTTVETIGLKCNSCEKLIYPNFVEIS
jgi:hypothetical protein